MRRIVLAAATAALACGLAQTAETRSLDAIKAAGSVALCAHPNSLPYASKTSDPPGFQIELARDIAKQLGIALREEWIVSPGQIYRTDCDMVMDTIADSETALAEAGLKVSKPYYRGGVGLAVPAGSAIKSFADLDGHTKVGVLASSLAAMTLGGRNVKLSTFGFEDDMLAALAAGELDAAAVTPLSAGYYIKTHPEQKIAMLPPDEAQPDLVWNVGIGMRHPDDAFLQAIDGAIDKLMADGTIHAIYARYGIDLQPAR